MSSNGRYDTMKMALAACIATIATGGGAWMVFGNDKVTRPELEATVDDAVEDSEALLGHRISANADAVKKLEGSVTQLVGSQQELIVEQRVLIQRVEDLLEDR